jgi:AcrR family transcriptional regulator
MPKIVDHDERRRDIAQAACRAVARAGVERLTMSAIAAESGFTTGMVTHYFKRKEDILRAALRVMLERAETRLAALMDDPDADPLDVFLAVLPLDAKRRGEAAVWVAFWGRVGSDAGFARINRTVHAEWIGIVERIMRARWPDADTWPEALFDEVRTGLLALMNGLTAGAVTSPDDYAPETQTAVATAYFDAVDVRAAALAHPPRARARR